MVLVLECAKHDINLGIKYSDYANDDIKLMQNNLCLLILTVHKKDPEFAKELCNKLVTNNSLFYKPGKFNYALITDEKEPELLDLVEDATDADEAGETTGNEDEYNVGELLKDPDNINTGVDAE